jgi:SAM-dependent methyltransferase
VSAGAYILDPGLLDRERATVREVDTLARRLAHEWGWHYLLDLVWILSTLDAPPGATVLDAGAGNGVLQYALAARGYEVLSVDFAPRRAPLLARLAFPVEAVQDGEHRHEYIEHLAREDARGARLGLDRQTALRIWAKLQRLAPVALGLPWFWLSRLLGGRRPGRVRLLRTDMTAMVAVPTASVDAVVSLSAVEHMDRAQLPAAAQEFRRVLRPGGKILVTTSAARDQDWFHEPSKGWCYGREELRRDLGLPEDAPDNWADYDELLRALRGCRELEQGLSSRYFVSGDNGMPWGDWDPQYLPVGVEL